MANKHPNNINSGGLSQTPLLVTWPLTLHKKGNGQTLKKKNGWKKQRVKQLAVQTQCTRQIFKQYTDDCMKDIPEKTEPMYFCMVLHCTDM